MNPIATYTASISLPCDLDNEIVSRPSKRSKLSESSEMDECHSMDDTWVIVEPAGQSIQGIDDTILFDDMEDGDEDTEEDAELKALSSLAVSISSTPNHRHLSPSPAFNQSTFSTPHRPDCVCADCHENDNTTVSSTASFTSLCTCIFCSSTYNMCVEAGLDPKSLVNQHERFYCQNGYMVFSPAIYKLKDYSLAEYFKKRDSSRSTSIYTEDVDDDNVVLPRPAGQQYGQTLCSCSFCHENFFLCKKEGLEPATLVASNHKSYCKNGYAICSPTVYRFSDDLKRNQQRHQQSNTPAVVPTPAPGPCDDEGEDYPVTIISGPLALNLRRTQALNSKFNPIVISDDEDDDNGMDLSPEIYNLSSTLQSVYVN